MNMHFVGSFARGEMKRQSEMPGSRIRGLSSRLAATEMTLLIVRLRVALSPSMRASRQYPSGQNPSAVQTLNNMLQTGASQMT